MNDDWSALLELSPTLLLTGLGVVIALITIRRIVGVHRGDHPGGERNLVGRALRQQSITPAAAEAARLEPALLEARTICARCTGIDDCRARLDRGQGPLEGEQCPNRALFRRIAAASDPAGRRPVRAPERAGPGVA